MTDGWQLCPVCRAVLYGKRLERNLWVCPDCGHHFRLDAQRRLDTLFDAGSVQLVDTVIADADPLGFTDTIGYPQRRAAARERTGAAEAVRCVKGTINGRPLIAAVMDFGFMGGSLGSAVGEIITCAGELALRDRVPLLIVSASGGARMQEGALSLMQMAKTSQMLGTLDEAGILTISLITDPTYGGVAASYATLADVIIAEPGARLGFAGPRVIEQTIRQPLPPGFQTAEFLRDHGLIDMLCPRGELRPRLERLLATCSPGTSSIVAGTDPVIEDADLLPARDAWQVVRQARDLGRPAVTDYIGRILTDFVALRGDRLAKDCTAIVGGPGLLGETPVMLIGTQKGHTAAELAHHNFGMASPAGYRKAARLMRLADKLAMPVVTLIDTPGAYPGLEAEEHGQAFAIAENLRLMAGLSVPTVAVVIGEGGSGGALALAVADRVLMCANGIYSVISPEGAAAILFGDAGQAPKAAEALRIDAAQLLRLGVIDGVIPELDDGHQAAAERLRDALLASLARLSGVPAELRRARRYERFRSFGAPDSVPTLERSGK